ncbi:MAG: beta-ketoacyl synthase N-terminal-like domain-containing protein, partial [Bdellovibrionales bacterium]
VITGLGMMTSVGYQAPQAITSLRAGLSRRMEFPDYEPIVREPGMRFPEPLIAAPVAGVTDGLRGIERLLALGVPALHEALEDAHLLDGQQQQTVLLVGGSQAPNRGAGSRIATILAPRLGLRTSKAPFQNVRYLPSGTASVLLAVRDAMTQLVQRQCRQCVVGGVDSWLDEDSLTWLDEKRRLKSASNPDSFIPGEAAAFIVLELQSNATRRNIIPHAQCRPVTMAMEKNTIWTEDPCTAEALSRCVQEVVAGLSAEEKTPDVALCDLNGESYRSAEWSYTIPKVFQGEDPVPALVHPADCLGDVGAATGAILLGLTAFSMKMKTAPWQSALLWCSSDDGERAASSLVSF